MSDLFRTLAAGGGFTSPPMDFAVNAPWLTAAMTGHILLARLKLLALDGPLHTAADWRTAGGEAASNPGQLAVGR